MEHTRREETVAAFWRGIDTHDWGLVAATLADGFVRVGMRGDEDDTVRGREAYVAFVSRVTERMAYHHLESRRTFLSADGRRVLNEAVETIQPTAADERNVMRFANVMELDADGLITRLDIYWKTPVLQPPAWIVPANAAVP
ncbi:nuclear transport factor 2 family protein [Streptomyces sp. H10-C2]|uniref:nuclear transport factor 2 family protein n=1 Tax=unclassified Streptomyces TaxID=2593676 RepID=UPI0024BA0E19|nr:MULTISPECIES: nuclear transport factor 2 family protein [unclassified Streptomyces]MDJ0342684.1 nuclear transport factor 2 family protein [Streptomyces sp. PH10-H1]MDJ0372607.1 nuclear transport factor 2 family protein [Streptomyces sp. H10-C2]